MAADPLPLVVEFLHSGDVQLRKNAVTALAAMASDASLIRLAEVALTDRHAEVGRKAEAEIRSLPADTAAPAVGRLVAALDDAATRGKAYAVLGRLRGAGMPFPLPSRRLATRLGLALLLRWQLNPPWDWAFWRRTLVPALTAGTLGVLFLALFLLVAVRFSPTNPEFARLVVAVLVLSPALAAWLTLFMCPIALHLYRGAAAAVDLLAVGGLGYLAAGGLFVFLLWANADRSPLEEHSLLFFVVLPAFAVAVRGGTLLAYGVAPNRDWNRVLQTATGGAAGVVAVVAVLAAADRVGLSIAGPLWVYLLATGLGLANAFAGIDVQGPRIKPLAGWLALPLCLTLLAAVGALVVLCTLGTESPVAFAAPFRAATRQGDTVVNTVGISARTQSVGFEVRFKQRVVARVLPEELAGRTRLELYRGEGWEKIGTGTRSPLDVVLEQGDYRVEATLAPRGLESPPEVPRLGMVLIILGNRLEARLLHRPSEEGWSQPKLEITLNKPGTPP